MTWTIATAAGAYTRTELAATEADALRAYDAEIVRLGTTGRVVTVTAPDGTRWL